ncbi:hypothetical protein TNIN_292051 [Trichonephila inaurata madagascariensis]|nr:hypothetical protein TNIN_292051 [Trichonephila inaurata madagascariensis]
MRRGHNKEDQFEPEEAENISIAPTSKSKQGQAAGIPEAEVVNNSIARKGKEERTATDPSPWKDSEEERLRIVEAAVAIIRDDIRSSIVETKSYPPPSKLLIKENQER